MTLNPRLMAATCAVRSGLPGGEREHCFARHAQASQAQGQRDSGGAGLKQGVGLRRLACLVKRCS